MPDKGPRRPYGLLLDAMEASDKVAIARVVMRSKEALVAIRPAGELLMMETMIFPDEVVPHDDLDDLPDSKDLKVSDREIKMAQQLIDSLSGEFEPEKYRDEYRDKVLDLIERKAAGEEIVVQPEAPRARQGPRPHGRARGEPRGGQGRRGRQSDSSKSNGKKKSSSRAKKPREVLKIRRMPHARGVAQP